MGCDRDNFNTVLLMVPQQSEWIVERFGKFHAVAQPGLSFAIPLIDRVTYKRSLKETTIPISPQVAITRDNVHVELDGAVYARVTCAYKASYGVEGLERAIAIIAQSEMRKQVGSMELDELFEARHHLNGAIAAALDEATEEWGIKVFRYEIADIHVDESTRDSMQRQSNAERLRRAEVLESDGYRQRAINEAQGEAEAVRCRAEAEAMQIRLVAEATADSIRSVADAMNQPASGPWSSESPSSMSATCRRWPETPT